MNPVLALGLVAAAGIAVTYLPRLRGRQLPHAPFVIATGAPLLLLGVLLGPGIELLEPRVLDMVAPLTALAIGWIGAVFGARFEWRVVRRVPRAGWTIVLAQAAAVFSLVGLAAWLFTRWRPELAAAWAPTLPAILTLAAVATVSGPATVAGLARAAGARPTLANAMGLAAALDTACGVLGFTLALALSVPHPAALGSVLAWGAWLLGAVVAGSVTGALFVWLTRAEPGTDLGFALLGAVLLGAGVGHAADLSPFVVCAVAAGVMVNLSARRRGLHQALHAGEHALLAILWTVAGALLRLSTPWVLVAVPVLAALRVLGQWAPVRWARGFLGPALLPRNAGLAMAAQGGVAVALAVNLHIAADGGAAAGTVATTIVLGVVCARMMAPPLMTRALRSPPVAPAPAASAPLPEPS